MFKGKSVVLQKIEHGDYDYSDYFTQAQTELEYCRKDQEKLTNSWKAFDDSLKYGLRDIEKRYRKRYNKLMEDHLVEEQRLLAKLKADLIKEFKKDVWDVAISLTTTHNLTEFYYLYRNTALENEKA